MEPISKISKRASLCRIHSLHRGITNVHVEVAKTPSAIMDGLMHRSYLPYDSGMVFIFPRPTNDSFWMKNTYIPLSIAFWDSDNTIISIMDMEPCEGIDCPPYSPGQEYVGAIEVNQGFFEEHGVDVGDSVEIIEMGGRSASTQKVNYTPSNNITSSSEFKPILDEWNSKKRNMGCVSATDWFCKRAPEFKPLRLSREKNDTYWEHVVAVRNNDEYVDLVSHLDAPSDWEPTSREFIGYKTATPINTRDLDIPIHPDLMAALHELHGQGHKSLVVGGAVRDAITGDRPKDIDVEVYGPSYEHLSNVLNKHGKVDVVGKNFGVIKFTDSTGEAHDVSLPRRDSKSGIGHKDFEVKTDPGLTPKEAAARRDFTINSMGWSPITHEFHDHYGGEEDLKNKVLKHTSDAFSEDPLRVLRGMQFSARYGMSLHPDTAKLCNSISDQYDTIPKERVSEEFMKMATKGKEPGRSLDYLESSGWMKHFPHLAKLRSTAQDSEWHPEGDVHEHTKHSMNAAAKICDKENITGDERAVAVLGTMVHDIGKSDTSEVAIKGGKPRIISHGHEQAGGPLARETLESMGIKPDIVDKVQPIVENHLAHINFEDNANPRTVRRLAQRLEPANIKEASIVMRADHAGRPPLSGEAPTGVSNMLKMAEENEVTLHKQEPIIKGRHLLVEPYNMQPGPPMGKVLRGAYEAQTNGEFSDEEGGKKWLSDNIHGVHTSAWKSISFR